MHLNPYQKLAQQDTPSFPRRDGVSTQFPLVSDESLDWYYSPLSGEMAAVTSSAHNPASSAARLNTDGWVSTIMFFLAKSKHDRLRSDEP